MIIAGYINLSIHIARISKQELLYQCNEAFHWPVETYSFIQHIIDDVIVYKFGKSLIGGGIFIQYIGHRHIYPVYNHYLIIKNGFMFDSSDTYSPLTMNRAIRLRIINNNHFKIITKIPPVSIDFKFKLFKPFKPKSFQPWMIFNYSIPIFHLIPNGYYFIVDDEHFIIHFFDHLKNEYYTRFNTKYMMSYIKKIKSPRQSIKTFLTYRGRVLNLFMNENNDLQLVTEYLQKLILDNDYLNI